MTKAHFRKLSQVEATIMVATAFICFSCGHYMLGIFAFILSLIAGYNDEGTIKRWNEEGYEIK